MAVSAVAVAWRREKRIGQRKRRLISVANQWPSMASWLMKSNVKAKVS
jgi:hypothetical protein